MIFLLFSCEKIEDNDTSTNENQDTLNDDLDGVSLNLKENLFYDFEADANLNYNYYSIEGIGSTNTIDQPCLLDERDSLNFYTFKKYLLEVKNCSDPSIICDYGYENYADHKLLDETYFRGDSDMETLCSCHCETSSGNVVNCSSNSAKYEVYNSIATSGACQDITIDNKTDCEASGWFWFDDFIDCSLMDANQDCFMEVAQEFDIINTQSKKFEINYSNLKKLYWDPLAGDAGRYGLETSSGIYLDTTITDETDIYFTSNYWSVINEWEEINGMAYIDRTQWLDSTFIIYTLPLDEDEPFIDSNENDIWDEDESFTDSNENGIWDEEQQSADIAIENTFEYVRTELGPDSLIFRKNSDCDNNHIQSPAEFYDDQGRDGCFDEEESGYPNYDCGACDPALTPNDIDGDGNCDYDPNNDNWDGEDYDKLFFTEKNEQYDEGESYYDRSDGLIQPEVYYDVPIGDSGIGNGVYDYNPPEPYADLNCNGRYDGWEEIDNPGNGKWDDEEVFIDFNGDGVWTSNEPLYSTSPRPDQIIVNYDTNDDNIVTSEDGPPIVLTNIEIGAINSAMVYVNGNYVLIDSIIIEKEYNIKEVYNYHPIEEIQTVYYNEIIEDVPLDLISEDYYITKTYWNVPLGVDSDGDGNSDRDYDYDYHLFIYTDGHDQGNGHLAKLVHPAYYEHYGYYETPELIDSGFYNISDFEQDIMIYTVGGNIREGERVTSFEEIDVDSNNDGVDDMRFNVSKEFLVEYIDNSDSLLDDKDKVHLPLRDSLGFVLSAGEDGNLCSEGEMITCFADQIISCPDAETVEDACGNDINKLSDCSRDTTMSAYKVTNTKNITMIGNGVEFGERNTIWLVGGIGIVMEKLEHRWTENTDTYDWKEYSRLELASQTNQEVGLLRNLFGGGKVIHFDDIENEEPFNGDTFENIKPTGTILRSKTIYE